MDLTLLKHLEMGSILLYKYVLTYTVGTCWRENGGRPKHSDVVSLLHVSIEKIMSRRKVSCEEMLRGNFVYNSYVLQNVLVRNLAKRS